jgi:hypothetical protein
MSAIGFVLEKLFGSAWRFVPAGQRVYSVDRAINFHEPTSRRQTALLAREGIREMAYEDARLGRRELYFEGRKVIEDMGGCLVGLDMYIRANLRFT